jgi:BRCT domain type II-containing protein
MASSGMLRRVALIRTDFSEEISVYIIKVTRIGVLRTTLAVISNRRTVRRNTKIKMLNLKPQIVHEEQFEDILATI